MRTHTHGLFFRLNEQEYAKLKHMSERSHLPMSTVIRKLILDKPISDYPPADYWKLYRAIEGCRIILPSTGLLKPQCNNCSECKQALEDCNATWRAVFYGLFTPPRYQEITQHDDAERGEMNGN